MQQTYVYSQFFFFLNKIMHMNILITTNDRVIRFQNSDYFEKWIHHSDGHTIERVYVEIFVQVLCIV